MCNLIQIVCMFYLLLLLYIIPVAFLIGFLFGLVKILLRYALKLAAWLLSLTWQGVMFLFRKLWWLMGWCYLRYRERHCGQ